MSECSMRIVTVASGMEKVYFDDAERVVRITQQSKLKLDKYPEKKKKLLLKLDGLMKFVDVRVSHVFVHDGQIAIEFWGFR